MFSFFFTTAPSSQQILVEEGPHWWSRELKIMHYTISTCRQNVVSIHIF